MELRVVNAEGAVNSDASYESICGSTRFMRGSPSVLCYGGGDEISIAQVSTPSSSESYVTISGSCIGSALMFCSFGRITVQEEDSTHGGGGSIRALCERPYDAIRCIRVQPAVQGNRATGFAFADVSLGKPGGPMKRRAFLPSARARATPAWSAGSGVPSGMAAFVLCRAWQMQWVSRQAISFRLAPS